MNSANQFDILTSDVEYLRHGNEPYLMRLYRPLGPGPFPMVVELHGGAWCKSDRLADSLLHESLARSGVIVAAPDWRQPPVASYPASFQDIHYAVRWLKAQAAELNGRADRVGLMGNSSGGHQAMLLAMRPNDPRYASLDGPATDAAVQCVILTSPVIDPIGRYHYAKHQAAKSGAGSAFASQVIPSHDAYWLTEAAMEEGAPASVIDRGEEVQLPPVLYVQGTEDTAHPRPHLDRFVATYRRAGGELELELFEGEGQGFIMGKPGSAASNQAIDRIIGFAHRRLI